MINRSYLLLAALAASFYPKVASADDKVKVELYYESQCPGCRETVTRSFKEAFDAPSFLKMADVTFIPFGNARESGPASSSTDDPYECQHGPTECRYNLIETCALDKIGCPHKQFEIINCIENYDESMDVDQDYDAVLNACSTLTGIPPDVAAEIGECYKGLEGQKLERDMADRTGALSPPPYIRAVDRRQRQARQGGSGQVDGEPAHVRVQHLRGSGQESGMFWFKVFDAQGRHRFGSGDDGALPPRHHCR